MKKIIMYLIVMLVIPFLLNAQYMGGNGSGDATISLTGVHLPIHNVAQEMPAKYELYQNFPNPFNPGTNIEFNLPEDGFVSIKIFDIAGKEIATEINNIRLNAGYYKMSFDGSILSSGVYFYSLVVDGKNITTKKMVLLK